MLVSILWVASDPDLFDFDLVDSFDSERQAMTPYERADEAAQWLRYRAKFTAAVVLGSGWGNVAALGEVVDEFPLSDIPGVPAPRVAGHSGRALVVAMNGSTQVLAMAGRSHLYEGYSAAEVVHGIRAVVRAGARRVVLTNAAGALNAALPVGAPVLLTDHLNLTGANPMSGAAPTAGWPGRFVDLTDVYNRRVRDRVMADHPSVGAGVYAGLLGGSYETPAEIMMLARLGADLVGMSTVLEAIAAHHAGAEVVGISLVTNMAAGISPTPLDHSEVLEVGRDSAGQLFSVVRTALLAP